MKIFSKKYKYAERDIEVAKLEGFIKGLKTRDRQIARGTLPNEGAYTLRIPNKASG